jgi:HEAT repeat protein
MKRFPLAAFLIVVSGAIGSLTAAQTLVPREKIPPDTPADVRMQIERLYSDSAVERTYGASGLGSLKERAEPAIPFLIGILGDKTLLEERQGSALHPLDPGKLMGWTSPGSAAGYALAKIGQASFQPLLNVLKTGQPSRSKEEADTARGNASTALGALGDKRAVAPIIEALGNQAIDYSARADFASALATLGDPIAIDALTVALRDPAPFLREYAARALRSLNDERAIGPLAEAIKDQDADVRHQAAKALTYTKGEGVPSTLAALLKNERPEVRKEALEALGERGSWLAEDASLIALAAIMTDPKHESRIDAAQLVYKMWANHTGSFRTMRDTATISSLIVSLKDDSMIVASVAADVLGSIHDRAAVPALIAALRENPHGAEYHNGYVHASSAGALARINDLSAVEPLIAALEGCTDCSGWDQITKALQQLTGNSNLGTNAAQWKLWWTRNKRRVLATHANS